jgi:hypothetical protein
MNLLLDWKLQDRYSYAQEHAERELDEFSHEFIPETVSDNSMLRP